MKKTILFLTLGLLIFIISGCSSVSQQEASDNLDKIIGKADRQIELNDETELKKNIMENEQSKQAGNSANLAEQYAQVILKTNLGDIKIKLYNKESPVTVNNFLTLAKKGFYEGTKFHRIIKDFMIQGGDPNSKDDDWSNDGMGGPGYKFQDEFNDEKLVRGSLAMANSGPNTNGSQFFIVTAQATPWLDGRHTNFGQVIEGMDVIDKMEAVEVNENDHPIEDVVIEGIELINKFNEID